MALLEAPILPESMIESNSRRLALRSLGLVFVGLGSYFLLQRPPITIIHLSAFAIVGTLSALLGALALQVIYVPPKIVAGWKSSVQAPELNDLGFRGVRIAYTDADCVIVLLGDSHAEAKALRFEAMPARRLESHLT